MFPSTNLLDGSRGRVSCGGVTVILTVISSPTERYGVVLGCAVTLQPGANCEKPQSIVKTAGEVPLFFKMY